MFCLLFMTLLLADPADKIPSRPVHTYSIVAYDAATGEVGAAVQSHWFSVGASVIWVEPGVGAVATQSFVNVDYGPRGLKAMKEGQDPRMVVKRLTGEDPGRDVRQLAMVDINGTVMGYTGAKCIDYACDSQGQGFSVQANIMLNDTVCDAMAKAYKASKGKPLAERLMAAMNAAQNEGGDLRGKQSAAIHVAKAKASDRPWRDTVMELRVEDHPDPLGELNRLVAVHRAYTYMDEGDVHVEHGNIDKAMDAYAKATSMLPGRVEPIYWQAVNLVGVNRLDEALPMFKKVFAAEPNWRKMTARLVKVGLLPSDPAVSKAIDSL